jgi:peptidoglycan DL-endopeptidase CwlO
MRIYLALLLSVALIVPAASASALPSKAAKMAQARAVKAQIDNLDNRLSIADENYNEAASKNAVLVGQMRAAAKKERKARRRISVLQLHLGTRASDMYRVGPLGFLDVLLGTRSFEELATAWDVLKDLNREDANSVAAMKVARAEATAAHAEYAVKQKASAKQLAIKAEQRASARGLLAQRTAKLRGIESEIKAIQAAQDAAARASAARSWNSAGGDGNYPNPTIPAHGNVVDYARSRLGCRYVWAGTGPRVFDCSGFTSWCYRQIGISLPHSSAAQIGCGQRVSRSNIQPGDLVFFGSPIHHVGMYIGGGMMIHAPNTGDVVKISSAFRGDYAGACRP